MSSEFFSLAGGGIVEYFPKHKRYHPVGKSSGLPGELSLDVKSGDTLFPWIKFEIWKRRKNI
jgi:hypothetical protein